jgi:hemolysin III
MASLTLVAIRMIAGGAPVTLASLLAYTGALMAMLGCSAAYNIFRRSPRRALLRRLDHAAIFLMIAGTYTPITTGYLDGDWSLGLTAAIWAAALAGIAIKFAAPQRFETLSVVVYLLLGWIGVVALGPLLRALPISVVVLLAAGGVLYSAGVVFHLWRGLRFHNAIWHIFVLCAAGCHYAAIVICVA